MIQRDGRYAYFLDVDGTLIDFADTPRRVRLDPAVSGVVDALQRSAGGAIALISGRSLADLDWLFPGKNLPAAGQHGLERRSANGRRSEHSFSPRPLDRARVELAAAVARQPRLFLEDKGLSLALHYRGAPSLAAYAHRLMHSMRRRLGERFCVHGGKQVVELAPAGRNKGAAIRAFMHEAPFRGRLPLFIGDDLTDEFGFAMVSQLGGVTIKVGPGATKADWRLPNVRAVLGWLEGGKPMPKRSAASQLR